MDYKLILTLWATFAISVVYWDMNRYDNVLISKCHKAEVNIYKNKYLCAKCEKWCVLYER